MEGQGLESLTTVILALITAGTAIATGIISNKSKQNSQKTLDDSKHIQNSVLNRIEQMESTLNEKITSLEITMQNQKTEFAKLQLNEDDADTIYNTIRGLLYKHLLSRCYIMQQHPLTGALWLSVVFETKEEGLSSIKQEVSNFPIADITTEYHKMIASDFTIIRDASDMESAIIKGIFYRIGSKTIVTKKLISKGRVIGFIVGSYNHLEKLDDMKIKYLQETFCDAASIVQDIIPEIN